MNGDVLNVKLGVCDVYIGGRHIGHTIGGVEVVYSPEYHETKVDKYTGVVERWLIGESLMAKVPMAEATLTNIREAITHGTNIGSTGVAIGSKSGKRSRTATETLRLHPIANLDSDKSDDVTIYKAHVTNDLSLKYSKEGERIIEVEFSGIVDESRTDGNMLGLIGDSL